MNPDCRFFRDLKQRDGGQCTEPAISLRNPQPSFGTCDRCEHNTKRGQMRKAIEAGELPRFKLKALTAEEQAAEEQRRAEEAKAAADIFHRLWRELHVRALSPDGLTNDTLDAISRQLPCGDCSKGYREFREANPLPDDPSDHFAWTVKLHNRVNAKLGKPMMTVADARRLYS